MSLILSGISKNYGNVKAVIEAGMEIKKGEVRAILGGNGSGKSTVAKILGGVVSKDTGTIELDGQDIYFKSPSEAKSKRVIMTSQELSLFDNLTVEENICICDVPVKFKLKTDKAGIRKKAGEILEVMNLSSLRDEKVESLAPNQKYMVEFAKAMVQNPQVLLIDEITSALYREDVKIISDLILRLKKEGCIILFISHRMSELYDMCDSVTVMKNGVTIGTYDMKEKNEDELLSLMAGENIVSYHGEGKHSDNISEDIYIRAPKILIDSYSKYESLNINRGEIIGIAGLQGHGQTDLIQALYGLGDPIEIELDGEKTIIKNAKKAVSHGFSYISGDREGAGTFSERDLAENVSAVQELVKNKRLGDYSKILDSFNVRYNNSKQLITELSGGNQQKVVVARWLSTRPRLVLADDPTKGIDVKARTDLHEDFAELAREGNAVIIVSSDENELVSITSMVDKSRVLVMYEGEIVRVLEGKDINRENIMSASMPISNKGKEEGGA